LPRTFAKKIKKTKTLQSFIVPFVARLRRHSNIAGAAAIALAAVVLMGGWWLGIKPLRTLGLGGPGLHPNAALGIIAAGMALCLLQDGVGNIRRRTGQLLALVPGIIGIAALIAHGFDTDLAFDRLLFVDQSEAIADQLSRRPTLLSAVALCCIALSLLMIDFKTLAGWHPGNIAAICAGVVASVGLFNNLINPAEFTTAVNMSLPGAVCVLVLVGGVLCARPARGPAWNWHDDPQNATVSHRPLIVGFLVAIAMLAGEAWLQLRHSAYTQQTAEWVAQTHDVEAELNRLLLLVQDIETGERGFLLTGDDAFLAPYEAGIRQVNEQQSKVLSLIRDDTQRRNLDALAELIVQRIALSERNVRIRQSEGFEAARRAVASGEGRGVMDRIRIAFADIQKRQAALLEERSAAADHEEAVVKRAIVGGTVLSILLLATVFGLLLRETNMRAEANRLLAQHESELTHANRELTDFAYIVSHDLKAPLRGIGSLAGWIAADYADRLDDAGREQIALLQGRVRRLNAMIDAILAYSRAGRALDQPEPVALAEQLPVIIDLLAPPAHIKISIDSPLPTVVMDPTKASQLFQNLLSNAIKYMDKSAGEVHLRCEKDGDLWHFSVADNGPGIEEKYFERIFRLFETLAPRDRIEGTGVGLALVKKIVELEGGRIWLESTVGRGTTFHFTLPTHPITRPPSDERAAG
jgi:signal transduction histidine kinase